MSKKQKLELTWIGKENRPRLEPRILLEDLEKSYYATHWVTEHEQFDKPLEYLLIPHDAIGANMSITGLAAEFAVV
jgi:hypothetical protein